MKRTFLTILFGAIAGIVIVPNIAYAQTIPDIIKLFGNTFVRLMPLLVSVAFLVFLYGVVLFISAAGDPKARMSGRSFMIWGIFALFIMVSVWGLVAVLQGVFMTTDTGPIDYPTINLGGGTTTSPPLPPPLIP